MLCAVGAMTGRSRTPSINLGFDGPKCVQGTMTEGRVPKEAGVQLQATTGSAMGGVGQPCLRAFTDVKAALDGLLSLAGMSAAAATADYASQARVQAMTGQVQS